MLLIWDFNRADKIALSKSLLNKFVQLEKLA